jgi:hypothetical protein
MNMKMYTSLGHQSVIPYDQYGNMFPLFIIEGSSMELLTGENASLVVL